MTLILFVEGHIFPAVLLFGFAMAAILVGDNVMQPNVMGGAMEQLFQFAAVGTFGSLESFGIISLLLGPVIVVAMLLI